MLLSMGISQVLSAQLMDVLVVRLAVAWAARPLVAKSGTSSCLLSVILLYSIFPISEFKDIAYLDPFFYERQHVKVFILF